ncbi:hypothetical protein [Niveispirillum sp. BGYR6]|uniref:hypothetical protein n=1 Tax=Niveispirillum sp. BGYR6 TaxID=2971249 RepID=UPI0022B9AE22|nr:hypothetical protein [Niveispirillum sp. BGYR6]MDG5495899.1 hypothetical protein [Niveispirillum sp. BGYR6]
MTYANQMLIAENSSSNREQEVAIAIKRCLESLVVDAKRSQMKDLAEFLALAALAADDAARAAARTAPRAMASHSAFADLSNSRIVGNC